VTEWSKPEKGDDGIWRTRSLDPSDIGGADIGGAELNKWGLEVQRVAGEQSHAGTVIMPPAAAVALLAAEASDRLGWKWRRYQPTPTAPIHMCNPYSDWWFDAGAKVPTFRYEVCIPDPDTHLSRTADELLASLHGLTLLREAMAVKA
jgi:hypothetical protein